MATERPMVPFLSLGPVGSISAEYSFSEVQSGQEEEADDERREGVKEGKRIGIEFVALYSTDK